MILVDTDPLVGLFDRKDSSHDRCVEVLRRIGGTYRDDGPGPDGGF
jgi:predicted nucleic acid-binding protein